jgi:hypothetical protein
MGSARNSSNASWRKDRVHAGWPGGEGSSFSVKPFSINVSLIVPRK